MSSVAAQPLLFEIPASPKRVKTRWEELQDMAAVSAEVGGLVTVSIAATLLDVSRQLVYELVEQKRFGVWEFFGMRYVAMRDVKEYHDSDREAGRPVDLSSKALWKRARKVVKQK